MCHKQQRKRFVLTFSSGFAPPTTAIHFKSTFGHRPLLESSPTTTKIPAGGGDTTPAAKRGLPLDGVLAANYRETFHIHIRPPAVVGVLTNNHEIPAGGGDTTPAAKEDYNLIFDGLYQTDEFHMIKDGFGRVHDYLRISLTDACNFRCTYCMPDEEMQFKASSHLMQVDEIDAIAGMFVRMGVRKIRLTGGEPLVRKEAAEIISVLSKYPVELTLTTNAYRAHEFIPAFKDAGIRSVNVSLDTLQADKFLAITRRAHFTQVWDNIQLLVREDFHVKVNVVMMRGMNEEEIIDFVEWTKTQPVHIRFIEFMPFSGNHWEKDKVVSYQEILDTIARQYDFIKLRDDANATAKKFKIYNHEGTFAIISTMSAPFCTTCNRMRLTADGKMKNCLFSKGEVDLLSAYRRGEDIMPMIEQCVFEKEEALGGQFTNDYEKIDTDGLTNRSMIRIGG